MERSRAMSNPPTCAMFGCRNTNNSPQDIYDDQEVDGLPKTKQQLNQQTFRTTAESSHMPSLFPMREDSDIEKEDEPTTVLPYLFLGNSIHGCSRHVLSSFGITHVLCVEEFFRREMPNIVQLHVPMSDAGNTELTEILPKCLDFFESAKNSNGKILCHCFAGINRSPTIILSYFMKTLKWTLHDSWCHLKSRRPIISPCFRYRRQLLEIEEAVFGKTSITLEEWAVWGHETCKMRVAEQLRRKLVGITVSASLLPPPVPIKTSKAADNDLGRTRLRLPVAEVVGRAMANNPNPQVSIHRNVKSWPVSTISHISGTFSPKSSTSSKEDKAAETKIASPTARALSLPSLSTTTDENDNASD